MANPVRRSALPITDTDLDQFEAAHDLQLPSDYRVFLLASNGGVPKANRFTYTLTTGKTRKANLKAFFPLTPFGWVEAEHPTVPAAREQLCVGWPAEYLAIGRAETDVNAGLVCLGVGTENAGQVFFRPDGEKAAIFYDVAKSLPELLDGMKPENPPEQWHPLVEAGDAEGFRAWCSGRTKLLRRDASDRNHFVGKCVEENQAALLDGLLTDFPDVFTAEGFVEEALSVHRLDLALRFLPAAKGNLRDDQLNRPGPYFWHAPVLVAALLEAGIDPTHESDDGTTSLHHAVRAAAPVASLDLLLAGGADPTHANDAGETPLALAEKIELPEIAATLRAAIARWNQAHPAPDTAAVTPFDLCGVTFTRTGKPISTAEIAATEAKLKLSFPPEYRWLLTQVNGGVPSAALMPLDVFPELRHASDEDDEDADDEPADDADDGYQVKLTLLPIRGQNPPATAGEDENEDENEDDGDDYPVEAAIKWYHDGSEMPRGMVPIGAIPYHNEGAGLLLLGCKGHQRGQLFSMDHRPTALNFTLPELFARLARAAAKPKTPADLLADAIQARDLDGVRAVLHHGAQKLYASRDGRRPLFLAAEGGFDEALALMADTWGNDEVMTHALSDNRIDFVRTRVLAGAKLKNKTLRNLLGDSNLYRDLALVEAVVGRGVKLDKLLADKDRSILLNAAESRNVAALEYLLARGGDVRYVGYESGDTLLHAAAAGGHRKDAADPRPMVAFLIAKGVPVHQGEGSTRSALHEAINAGDRVAAETLIDAGASMTVGLAQNAPMRNSPQMQELMARAGKQFDKMLEEFDAIEPPDLNDEDALDLDDPALDQHRETMGQLGGVQDAMNGMMGKLQAKMETPAAERVGPTAQQMYAQHHVELVEHLMAYEAVRK